MDGLVPGAELEQRIAPAYPKPGRGRRPYPLRVMLRIHRRHKTSGVFDARRC